MKAGREVSCRAFGPINDLLQEQKVDIEALFVKLPITRDFAENTKNSVSWDIFATFLHLVGEAVGGDRIEQLFTRVDNKPGNEVISSLVRCFANAKSIYWATSKYIPLLFRHVEIQYTEMRDGRIQFVIRIPEPYQDSREFFLIWARAFRLMPKALGLPDSHVERKIEPKLAIYWITPPRSQTLWSRLRAFISPSHTAEVTINELAHQNEEIKRYYEQLLESQRKVQEQDTKIQLSAQLTALSNLAALGEMAGAISHEINNPLMILFLKTGLLKRRIQEAGLPEEATRKIHKDLDDLRETSERIAKITRGLLSFAGENNHEQSQKIPVREIVRQTVQLCGQKFHNAQIRLEFDEMPPDALIECRSSQLSHALLNLMNNSYDAVAGKPERWVRLGFLDQGEQIELTVMDSGHGIPEPERLRIFEPFYTTKGLGKGTGLGLSISRGLIESHRGALTLNNQATNTQFIIRLPKACPPQPNP